LRGFFGSETGSGDGKGPRLGIFLLESPRATRPRTLSLRIWAMVECKPIEHFGVTAH